MAPMGTDLQRLRDEAENRSRTALANNDRDSADAWERIGLAIDECIQKTKHDINLVEARTGLFGLRAESTACAHKWEEFGGVNTNYRLYYSGAHAYIRCEKCGRRERA